jgi:hypothetical protein
VPCKNDYVLLLLGDLFTHMERQGITLKHLPVHVRRFYRDASADEDAQADW